MTDFSNETSLLHSRGKPPGERPPQLGVDQAPGKRGDGYGTHPGTPAEVLFILPDFLGSSSEIRSPWTASAALAAAIGRLMRGVDVLTPNGIMTPEEVAQRAVHMVGAPGKTGRAVRRLPQPLRLALGDTQTWVRGRKMRRITSEIPRNSYRLIVQLHHRFQDCGLRLAKRWDVPLVLRLDALEMREEAAWGMPRAWGRALETVAELSLIRKSDLAASVSEVLDSQLDDACIPPDKRLVLPNGVDLDLFSPGDAEVEMIRAQGLDDRFRVGWTGGFRPYHGLEVVPDMARGLKEEFPEAVICLLGMGPLREEIASRTRGLEDWVRFIDPVPQQDVPRWIRCFDVCLLLAQPGPFHYSPLKLYEYLACGRPVIASDVGNMGDVLSQVGGMLVSPRRPRQMLDAVKDLADDPELRARLASNGRSFAEQFASWDARARALLTTLEERGLVATVPRDDDSLDRTLDWFTGR